MEYAEPVVVNTGGSPLPSETWVGAPEEEEEKKMSTSNRSDVLVMVCACPVLLLMLSDCEGSLGIFSIRNLCALSYGFIYT